jgi:hypothetical protein
VADDPKYFTRVSIPEHEPRLEFYFKAHCPGCKLFKPVWKQLFDEHPPSKFIALDPMDCDKNDFRDSGISNVPTIVFRANANAKFIKYSGASSSRDIYKWTKLQLKDIRTNKDDV